MVHAGYEVAITAETKKQNPLTQIMIFFSAISLPSRHESQKKEVYCLNIHTNNY